MRQSSHRGSGSVRFVIDLRSDTTTQPTPAMREAIANAAVGDEQEREDPTVLELERRVAAFLGQEEAVFLPTATMANQIALRILGRPGDELLAEENSHVFIYELGGPAVFSGLVMRGLPGHHGKIAPEQIRAAMRDWRADTCRSRGSSRSRTRTTPPAGGSGRSRRSTRSAGTARELDLRLHLDGARIVNAATALGVPAAEIGRRVDTVTLCLSKGLGCPLGALVAGSAELMVAARRAKAPLRRRDAPGGDRRRGRRLRARPPRRADRRRPRARAAARRGVGRRRARRSTRSRSRRTSSSSTSGRSG